MTNGDRPSDSHSKTLVMDDEFDDEDDYEIIDADDLEVTLEAISAEESEASASDSDTSPEMTNQVWCCMPSVDHASLVLQKHDGAVFCIGLNPKNENMIITGGQDDKAYIWNCETGEILLESTGFTDSVTFASFNHDGRYAAAIDMAGKVNVWKTTSHPFQLVWENKMDDIQWMKWHQKANILLIGETSGSIYMWKVPSGECKVLYGHTNLTDVGEFMPDGKRMITCYADGSIKIYNLATTSLCFKYDGPETHRDSFISIDINPENNLVALGSDSSRLYVIKTEGVKAIQDYRCLESDNVDEDDITTTVECVSFSRNLPYKVIAAATNNALHVFDYIKWERRGYIPVEEGITRFVWPEESNTLFVATKVGKIAVCDVRGLKVIAFIEGHSRILFDIVLSRDKKTLITGSDDKCVRFFKLDEVSSREGFSIN